MLTTMKTTFRDPLKLEVMDLKIQPTLRALLINHSSLSPISQVLRTTNISAFPIKQCLWLVEVLRCSEVR